MELSGFMECPRDQKEVKWARLWSPNPRRLYHTHIFLFQFSVENLFSLLKKLKIAGLGIKLINDDHLIKLLS